MLHRCAGWSILLFILNKTLYVSLIYGFVIFVICRIDCVFFFCLFTPPQDLKKKEKELQAKEAELNKREKVFCH